VAFQGICRLATHQGESDLTQGTGFIGSYDAAARIFRAIRECGQVYPTEGHWQTLVGILRADSRFSQDPP